MVIQQRIRTRVRLGQALWVAHLAHQAIESNSLDVFASLRISSTSSSSSPLSTNSSHSSNKAWDPFSTLRQADRVEPSTASTLRNYVVWEGTLRAYNSELLRCSFWRTLESRKDPIPLVASKALPQRCQKRQMADTILDKFEQHPDFEASFRDWIDCSLLGLYHHSTSSLSIPRLLEFFDMRRSPERHRLFHIWLLKRQDLLCIFMTRNYLIWCLPQQPALLDAVRHSFSWDRFVGLCTRVGDQVCRLINEHGWSALFLGDPDPAATMVAFQPLNQQDSEGWQSESSLLAGKLTKLTSGKGTRGRKRGRPGSTKTTGRKSKRAKGAEPTSSDIVVAPHPPQDSKESVPRVTLSPLPDWTLQYATPSAFAPELARQHAESEWTPDMPRPYHHRLFLILLDRLVPVWQALGHDDIPRNYERLVRLLETYPSHQNLLKDWAKIDADNKKRHVKINEDLDFLSDAQKAMSEVFYYRQNPTFLNLVNTSRNKVPPTMVRDLPGIDPKEMTNRGITRSHLLQMMAWIDRCQDYDEQRAQRLLLAFGMPQPVLQQILELKTAYESRIWCKRPVINGLASLKFESPYSYALQHTFAYLWTRHIGFRHFPLSASLMENQIRAIRGRFRCRDDTPIPECAIYMVVCLVCDNVCSLYNDATTMYNPMECFGYTHVRQRIQTGDMYCNKENVIAHANIKNVKLSRILVLGRVVQFRKKLWLLCPQPNCGMLCVFQPQTVPYTEYGPACSWCANQLRERGEMPMPDPSLASSSSSSKRGKGRTRGSRGRGRGARSVRGGAKAGGTKSTSDRKKTRKRAIPVLRGTRAPIVSPSL